MTSFLHLNAVATDMQSMGGTHKGGFLPNHTLSRSDISPEIQEQQDAIRLAAHDFEAAFITQMLTFSGLGKALTTGGGEAMSAFTGFYIESFAEEMTQAGGLGLAERFYDDLLKTSGLPSANNSLDSQESKNDDFGLL